MIITNFVEHPVLRNFDVLYPSKTATVNEVLTRSVLGGRSHKIKHLLRSQASRKSETLTYNVFRRTAFIE